MPTVFDVSQFALNAERWITEARGGSREALDRLLESYSPYLFAHAKHGLCAALRCRLDAGDVVQETLLKGWRYFSQFRGETELEWRAWLRQILRRTLANERREHIQSAVRSIRREVPLVEASVTSRRDESGSSCRQARTQEQQEWVKDALRRLPTRYRQVLHLHTQAGMTFAQVGVRLHCSAEAARKLWRRAAEKLAQLLRDIRRS